MKYSEMDEGQLRSIEPELAALSQRTASWESVMSIRAVRAAIRIYELRIQLAIWQAELDRTDLEVIVVPTPTDGGG
jgi:hypothetical protein